MKKLNILLVLLITVQAATAQYDEQKIHPEVGYITDFFGVAVGMSGNYAIIGAWGDDEIAANSGAAYIYFNNEGTWVEHTKLLASNGYQNGKFASRVDVSGDYAVGATTQYNNDRGAVYIFNNNGGIWEEQQFIEKPDVPAMSMFGSSVSIDGNNVIIGMRTFSSSVGLPGAAFIYNYNGATWEQTAELIPNEAVVGDWVGASSNIAGDYAIVGAHGTDGTLENEGAAYIYKNIDGTWTKIIQLKAGDPAEDDFFGTDVAIHNNFAMVGANRKNNYTGAVYVFENNNDTWGQTQKIIAPDASSNDQFGYSIDFNNEVLVIGAKSEGLAGAAYVYKNIDGTWTFFEKIIPSDGELDDDFGNAIALSGDNFIVAAQWCDIFGTNSGAAYVYSTQGQSSENDIVQFDILNQIGNEIINGTEHTVTLEVASGTIVTNLTPVIEISDFAIIDPPSGVSQDFTNPVEYTVTAQNGEEQIWIITVNVDVTHDLGVNQIKPATIYFGDSAKIFPTIQIHNFGTETETDFEIEVVINNGIEDVYDYTQTTNTNLAPGNNMYVTMDEVWAITDPELTYTINATVILSGDDNPANDLETITPVITQLTYTKQSYAMNYIMYVPDKPFISINLETGDQEIIIDDIDPGYMSGAEFVYGVLYGLKNDTDEFFIYKEDGTKINLGIITGTEQTPTGITYDAEKDIMYVVTVGNVYTLESEMLVKDTRMHDCSLHTLNMQTLELTEIGNINGGTDAQFFDIEYANGSIYAIEVLDMHLWEINPGTGEGSPKPQYLTYSYMSLDQSLSYDPVTETMYATLFHWASGSDYKGYFCTVNLNTGSATNVQVYGIDNNVKFFAVQPSVIKNITSFQIPSQVGETEINNELHTITVNMPLGTNVTNLIPEIEVAVNVTEIDPPGGIPQDFTNPVEYTLTGKFGYTQIWTVTVDILTGIFSDNPNSFNISPNPSTGIINLSGFQNPIGLEITDITGKTIYTSEHGPLAAPLQIDLSGFNKGIYFIRIKTENNNYSKKLIIQ